MDTTKAITHVSLCAGYGGIDLGLRRVLPALRTIAYAEREGFCCANLVSKVEAGLMDAAPIWTDVKTFPWSEFRDRVDILSGGYPCQPFSAAGKRLGAEDPRHLWPHISAGIALMRPAVCFFENVEGHISLGLPDVIEDLAGLGYRTTWGIFSASEVGAPHQRKRVFILAYRHGERGQLPDWWRVAAEQVPVGYGETWRDGWPSRPGEPQHWWEPPRVVANAGRNERREDQSRRQPEGRVVAERNGQTMADACCMHRQRRQSRLGRRNGRAVDAAAGNAENERDIKSSMDGSPHGPADWLDDAELYTTCDNRTDELRLLGNGVVPATAERAFRVLVGELVGYSESQ